MPLSKDRWQIDGPSTSPPDGDSPSGSNSPSPSTPNTAQLLSVSYREAGTHEEAGAKPSRWGDEISCGGGSCDVGRLSSERDADSSKPQQFRVEKGAAKLQSQLRINPLTLRFSSETMEAAYLYVVHAKLIEKDVWIFGLTPIIMISFLFVHGHWILGHPMVFVLSVCTGMAFPAWLAWRILTGRRGWYIMYRERFITLAVLFRSIQSSLMQLHVPPSILPGTTEAKQYASMMMYLVPVGGFIWFTYLRIRFSTSAIPVLAGLVCYLIVAAPYAVTCSPCISSIWGSPTLYMAWVTTMMVASIGGPVIYNRATELQERRDFAQSVSRNGRMVVDD